MSDKLRKISTGALLALTALITLACAVFTVGANQRDIVYLLERPVQKSFIILSAGLLITGALILLCRHISQCSEKRLKIYTFSLFSLFLIAEAVVLTGFDVIPNTDSYRCIDTAAAFANGDISTITPTFENFGYFQDFSNNNLFIMLLYITCRFFNLFGVQNYIVAFELINAALIFVGVVLLYLTVKRLFDRKKAVMALALAVLSPTLYFFVGWVYTATASIPLMMGIIYIAVRVRQSEQTIKRAAWCALAGLLASIGYLLRPTAVFPVFACAVFILINFRLNKKFLLRTGACVLSFIIIFCASFLPLKAWANSRFEQTLKYNFPITHWVMMGMSGHGDLDQQLAAYTKSFKTKSEKIDANIRQIKKTMSEYNALSFMRLLMIKTKITWTDGTNQYDFRLRQNRSYNGLYYYTVGDKSGFMRIYCQAFRLSLFLLVAAYLIMLLRRRKGGAYFPIIITLLGGYIFYLIWEAKAEYSLPFLPLLVILAAAGADRLADRFFTARSETALRTRITAARTTSLALSVLLCVYMCVGFAPLTIAQSKKSDYAIHLSGRNPIRLLDRLQTDGGECKQSFVPNDAFNTLDVAARVLDNKTGRQKRECVYGVELSDENGRIIAEKTVTAFDFAGQNPKAQNVTLKFDTVTPKTGELYYIRVFGIKGDTDTIGWPTKVSYYVNHYSGALVAQGKSLRGCMVITASNVYSAAVYPTWSYITLCLLVCTLSAAITFSWKNKKHKGGNDNE